MMKKVLKIICVLSLTVILLPVLPVQAKDTVINDMNIDIVLDKNGTAAITEVLDMYVDEKIGDTEIYKVFVNAGNQEIHDFTVKDETGKTYKNTGEWDTVKSFDEKAYTCGILDNGDGQYELCFGVSHYGSHTYTLSYTIDNFVEQYEENQGINYIVLNKIDWDIAHVKVTLSDPDYGFSKKKCNLWGYSYDGTAQYDNGSVILETDKELTAENNKMQLLLEINDDVFEDLYENYSYFTNVFEDPNSGEAYNEDIDETYDDSYDYEWDDDDDDTGAGLLLIIFIVGIGIFAFWAFLKEQMEIQEEKNSKVLENGKVFTPVNAYNVKAENDLPCNHDFYRFFYYLCEDELIGKSGYGGLFGAILMHWILQHDADYESHGEAGVVFKHEEYSVSLHHEEFSNEYEKKVYEYFMEAAGENKLLERKEFEKWCKTRFTEIETLCKEILQYEKEQLIKEGLIIESTKTDGKKEKKIFIYTDQYMEEMKHAIAFYSYLNALTHKEGNEDVHAWEEYMVYASVACKADVVYKELGKLYPEYQDEPYYKIQYHQFEILFSMCYEGAYFGYDTLYHPGRRY